MFEDIWEETGIYPNIDNINIMNEDPIFTSCGVLDEKLYLYELQIDPKIVKNLNVETCGTDDEVISGIKLFKLRDAPINDAKFLIARDLFVST